MTRGRPLALLLDRDVDTRQMYAEFLRQSGYHTEEAEDGRDALALAAAIHPTVIISETRLAGMSGLEFCRRLRSEAATQAIPLVFVTADAYPNDLKVAEAAGATRVLVKPCLPDRLLVELEALRPRTLGTRSRAPRPPAGSSFASPREWLDRSRAGGEGQVAMSYAHDRRRASRPPVAPVALVCPHCRLPLISRAGRSGSARGWADACAYAECAACSKNSAASR